MEYENDTIEFLKHDIVELLETLIRKGWPMKQVKEMFAKASETAITEVEKEN